MRGECKCVKDTEKEGVEVGGVYTFKSCVGEKRIYLNDSKTVYNVLVCKEDYFNEHFEVVKQLK